MIVFFFGAFPAFTDFNRRGKNEHYYFSNILGTYFVNDLRRCRTRSCKRISVTRFSQQVDHVSNNCRGWEYTMQDQLRTVLERELSNQGLKVLERQSIRQIYNDEYELPNMNQKSKPKRGKFLSAQYTVTGGIVELGICEESSGTGIQLGGVISLLGGPSSDLHVGKHSSTSKVRLVAQLLLTETGEIIKSFEANAEISDSGFAVQGSTLGIGGEHNSENLVPIERASNNAIRDLATQISEYVNH